jgi:hypothetical protein
MYGAKSSVGKTRKETYPDRLTTIMYIFAGVGPGGADPGRVRTTPDEKFQFPHVSDVSLMPLADPDAFQVTWGMIGRRRRNPRIPRGVFVLVIGWHANAAAPLKDRGVIKDGPETWQMLVLHRHHGDA